MLTQYERENFCVDITKYDTITNTKLLKLYYNTTG